MKKKIAAIVGIVGTVMIGSAIGLNTDIGKKALDCAGKDVQIEYLDSYYCGSDQEFSNTYASFKDMLTTNKLHDKLGIMFGRLALRHDKAKHDEIKQIFLDKYDPDKKEFRGSDFDSDIMNQFEILIDIANIECNGRCELIGETTSQQVYNLIK